MASIITTVAFTSIVALYTGLSKYQEQGEKPIEKETSSQWEYDEDLECYLRSLPKVELHVHFDGSLDSVLLHKHLKDTENYDCLPVSTTFAWDPENPFKIREQVQKCETSFEFRSMCICRGKSSLKEMIKCFEIFVPIVRGNLSLLEQLAFDFVKRQADQNIIYTEVRYSPHLLAEGGSLFGMGEGADADPIVDADPVVDALTRGFRRGEVDFGVKVNQIICCLTYRPDWAHDIIRIANERRNDSPCAVVGIDIASGEDHFDEENNPDLYGPHMEAFEKAKELNLNITLHAGEVGEPSNIQKAVQQYGAKRIGHGYNVIHDEELIESIVKQNIHFEICPTSSVETGGWEYPPDAKKNWKDHPCVHMVRHGVNIGFNSDDPAVFNTSLTWQLRIAMVKMGFGKEFLFQTVLNSIDAAFISEEEKIDLRNVMNDFAKGEGGRRKDSVVYLERVSDLSDMSVK